MVLDFTFYLLKLLYHLRSMFPQTHTKTNHGDIILKNNGPISDPCRTPLSVSSYELHDRGDDILELLSEELHLPRLPSIM